MTFYDDAELAAVEAVRLASAEDGVAPRSAEIHAVTQRLFEQHGADGLAALVIALARWNASAFLVLAMRQGKTIGQVIDEWEMDKLTQHADEEPL